MSSSPNSTAQAMASVEICERPQRKVPLGTRDSRIPRY